MEHETISFIPFRAIMKAINIMLFIYKQMLIFLHLQLAYQRISNIPMHHNGCTVPM